MWWYAWIQNLKQVYFSRAFLATCLPSTPHRLHLDWAFNGYVSFEEDYKLTVSIAGCFHLDINTFSLRDFNAVVLDVFITEF